eukprot:12425521-Karenia_brevis.AAC.1
MKPASLPRPRVHCSDAEFVKLAVRGLQCGVFTAIPENEVYKYNGKPVLNGAFGLWKDKKGPRVASETQTLPYVGDLVNIVLGDDEVLDHVGEDLSICFFLFAVNRQWSS